MINFYNHSISTSFSAMNFSLIRNSLRSSLFKIVNSTASPFNLLAIQLPTAGDGIRHFCFFVFSCTRLEGLRKLSGHLSQQYSLRSWCLICVVSSSGSNLLLSSNRSYRPTSKASAFLIY